MTDNVRNPFVCPGCGGSNPGGIAMVSPSPNADDPWSDVLEIIECGDCHESIPAHLAERWDNQPIEDARREWREVYRCGR